MTPGLSDGDYKKVQTLLNQVQIMAHDRSKLYLLNSGCFGFEFFILFASQGDDVLAS
jgi:hypothetical protein